MQCKRIFIVRYRKSDRYSFLVFGGPIRRINLNIKLFILFLKKLIISAFTFLLELSRFGGEEDSRNEVSRTLLQEGEEASSGLGDNESSEDNRPMQVHNCHPIKSRVSFKVNLAIKYTPCLKIDLFKYFPIYSKH